MAIPDYQTLMLPVLRAAASGEVSVRDCIARLADEFTLADEERAQLLPSGRAKLFVNRVQWAKTYLAKAGVVELTRRGHFVTTKRGLDLLKQQPARVDNSVLGKFEEFRAFRAASRLAQMDNRVGSPTIPEVALDAATPEERVEAAAKEIEDDLREELLDRIMKASPAFFEKVVVDLLIAMNYGAGPESGQRIGRTGDGGAMVERGATKGVFVTTSHFAGPARTYAERIPQRLILIDGVELTRLLVRYGVGVRTVRSVELKKADLDYFEDDEA